jgi:Holliday junction resolvase
MTNSRDKGARGERELVRILRAAGWPNATRNTDGRYQAGRGDIDNGPANTHIECKRSERAAIWEWLAQAERDAGATRIPIVAFRRSRSAWYAVVPLDELLALIKHREDA